LREVRRCCAFNDIKTKEESSFCEQKEAKNFDPLSFGYLGLVSFIRSGLAARVTDQETTSGQSFFASFCSQKEDSSFVFI
jgi:hypothetical protein